MRWRFLRAFAVLAALAAFPVIVPACSGTTTSMPAAAPAPEVELPSPAVLKFVDYQGLQIDLSKVTSIYSPKTFDPFDPYDQQDMTITIWMGPHFFELFVNQFFAPALEGIRELAIPVSGTTTTFEAAVTFTPTTEAAGTCWLCLQDESGNYLPRKVKLDFADFDFDSDGQKEGCSGSTLMELDPVTPGVVKPVCVRFWLGVGRYDASAPEAVTYEPFLAGIFREFPCSTDPNDPDAQCRYGDGTLVPDTIGKGSFRMHLPDFDGYESTFAYGYEEQPDLPSKRVEYFFETVYLPDSPNHTPCQGFYCPDFDFATWDWHSALSQEGPAATALKNVGFTYNLDYNPPLMSAQYLGQYVEDDALWSGSILNVCPACSSTDGSIGGLLSEHLNMCATLGGVFLGYGAPECTDVGSRHLDILVRDTPFLPPLTPSDIMLPGEFPPTPTF